jgi:uncharacterized protein YecT (DUF1311 family)
MIKSRIIIIVLFLVLLGSKSFGQTTITIDSLEESYQACLDKGINMLGCSKRYYNQMDSMLNLVYRKLCKKISPSQGSKLKSEQLKWLSTRDQYFKNIPLDEEEKALQGEDRKMLVISKKADFVKERVLGLIKKL